MLLTTGKTESFGDACQRLDWYSRRWGIEVYHRTLKSGCRIEDRRLEDRESLEACLALDLVVAWRVYWLALVGLEEPHTACDQILKEEEWRVLKRSGPRHDGRDRSHAPGGDALDRQDGRLAGERET